MVYWDLIEIFDTDSTRIATFDPELDMIRWAYFDLKNGREFLPVYEPLFRHLGMSTIPKNPRNSPSRREFLELEILNLWNMKLVQYLPIYEKHMKRGTRVSGGTVRSLHNDS